MERRRRSPSSTPTCSETDRREREFRVSGTALIISGEIRSNDLISEPRIWLPGSRSRRSRSWSSAADACPRIGEQANGLTPFPNVSRTDVGVSESWLKPPKQTAYSVSICRPPNVTRAQRMASFCTANWLVLSSVVEPSAARYRHIESLSRPK
jgi:hypothetical protein